MAQWRDSLRAQTSASKVEGVRGNYLEILLLEARVYYTTPQSPKCYTLESRLTKVTSHGPPS